MNFWAFYLFIWLIAQMLSLVADHGSGFTSTPLVAPVTAADRYIPVKSRADMPDQGSGFRMGEEVISYTVRSTCGRFTSFLAGQQFACLDTGVTGRGTAGTVRAPHPAGRMLQSEATDLLSKISKIQNVSVNMEGLGGKLSFPAQLTGALGDFLFTAGTWDYNWLDGPGWYLRVFLLGLNFLAAIAFFRLFAGPIASMFGGLGGVVGRLFGLR